MSRVTAKGQVTIPKAVREDLGIRPGDEIDFVKIESGGYRIRKIAPTTEAGEDPFEKHRGRADDASMPDRMRRLRGEYPRQGEPSEEDA